MGDVMKESAKAAISYIRSKSDALGIHKNFHKDLDIHIHIPEGAVPKDGPSAGITMATAMISALTSRPVRGDIAMTGEVTISGRVLAIGGLKEKMMAAKNFGIKTVLIPRENEGDYDDLPDYFREGIDVVFVKTMQDVTSAVFI
jgi:ATP-dependent Lon protease